MSSKYVPSAAALHAARVILQNFTFTQLPQGQFEASEKNLVLLIDWGSQIYRVESCLQNFVKKVRWFEPNELAENVEVARESLRALQIVREGMPRFAPGKQWDISAPAQTTARAILAHFSLKLRPMSRMEEYADQNGYVFPSNLARLIDYCTDSYRVNKIVDLVFELPWEDRNDIRRCMSEFRATMQALDFTKRRLPHFGGKSIARSRMMNEPRLVREQVAGLKTAGNALEKAKNPADEQRILKEVSRQGLLVPR